jgi:hypothetical protein
LHPRQLAHWLTEPLDDLSQMANRFGTDKGSLPSAHHYTRVYSELFEAKRDSPVRLLEIGLLGLGQGGWNDESLRESGRSRGRDAPSLRMWSAYFRQGQIYGVDFNDFSSLMLDRCQIFRADAGNADELAAVAESIGGALDIVIDDGSHASHEQQVAMGVLFPFVAPGGLYVIEDLFYQPADRERPDALPTVQMLRRAEVTGAFEAPHLSQQSAAYLSANADRVALFDSLSSDGALVARDALGVIWKKA